MERNKLDGIPYLGENTYEIEETIKNSVIQYEKDYESLYELINNEVTTNKLVVIDDNNSTFLSYLRDIRFNYRDKVVFIPYFKYKIYEIDKGSTRSNYKGHLILTDNTIKIRYEYKLSKLDISKENNTLILFDVETLTKYKVSFKNWINDTSIDMNKLYKMYLNSCVEIEDYFILKHTEGYHLIYKKLEGVKNKEKELRQLYNLKAISSDGDAESIEILNYRDVRNYTINQMYTQVGMIDTDIPYWKRILDFEMYLFSIIREHLLPDGEFRKEWEKLGKTKEFIKYGDSIKLIIKDYWLDNIERNKDKTWIK